MQVRALGCRPRNAKTCRPGTNVGVRRAGPRPPPLSARATRRAVEDFAAVARALAASAETRAAFDLQRATARAARRTARTRTRVMAGAARRLAYLAAATEHAAATRLALAGGRRRKAGRSRKPATAPRPRSRPDFRRAQERVLREQEALTPQAHEVAAPADPPPAFDPDLDRRLNEIAARCDTEPPRGPRIRRLW